MQKDRIFNWFYEFLISKGIQVDYAIYLNLLINITLLITIILIVDFITMKIIVTAFNQFASKTKTNFDDYLIKNKAPKYLAHLVPVFLVLTIIPFILKDFPKLLSYSDYGFQIYFVVLSLWLIRSLLKTLKDYLKSLENFRDKPIDSYIQVFMIFAWMIGVLIIFSIITQKSVWSFIGAFGAVSAVVLLIFKDTILGFVASIQVSINDIVRIGDWITMEKYGADGDVLEINLATVKVRNFDNTTTTIPTYYLISDSFKNWRGMQESSGRRIKRAVLIRANSVRFVNNDEIEKFRKIQHLTAYIDHRQNDIKKHNHQNQIDKSLLINGRNLTNLGLFRKYIDQYIGNHPAINKEMMIMTRHLAPTPQGIPIEVYAFSTDKRWENFEHIMADIFDHLLAAIPYFDLECFELPSTTDFRSQDLFSKIPNKTVRAKNT
ncbi:MAG: mechanosensitive ion channel [Flavobacteriaceae bacterium]|nr:mechanosensitive ion channel [Flavobacteriaceae bacterium]